MNGDIRVPDGDVEDLISFMDRMSIRQRELVQQFRRSISQANQAQMRAADEILNRSNDVDDTSFLRAAEIALTQRVHSVPTAAPDEQRATFELVARQARLLLAADSNPSDLGNAGRVSAHLEEYASTDLAIRANELFSQLFGDSGKPKLTRQVATFEAAIRRLEILGEPLALSGELIEGERLDWSEYSGKTILVAFWSPDVDATTSEVNRIKLVHAAYHDAGFEVVGVCPANGQSKSSLRGFLSAQSLPWDNLIDEDSHGGSWTSRLGVKDTPAFVLVNDQGDVVSVKADGSMLASFLRENYGPETLAARARAVQDDWSGAAERTLTLIESAPLAARFRIARGACLLLSGNREDYQAVCQDSIQVLDGSSNHFALAQIVQLCALSDDCGVEPAQVLELADRIRQRSGNNSMRLAKGMACLRVGDWQACLRELPQGGDPQQRTMADYCRAMASFHQGNRQQTEMLLERANAAAKEFFSDPSGTRHGRWMLDHWICCAIVDVLSEEANTLVKN